MFQFLLVKILTRSISHIGYVWYGYSYASI